MSTNERYTDLIDFYRKEKKFQRQYHEGLRYLLEPYGLSVMEADLLFAICRDPLCDNVTKLCADIGKTKGVVSRACDHLCKENYLISRSDDSDHRVIHFKTTPAVRSLISGLSRYMETMEYIHKADQSGNLLSGRLDRKKALFYPIEEKDPLKNVYSYLPFCSYESFLNEQCLPRLSYEDQIRFKEKYSLTALEEKLRQKEQFESIWRMRFNGNICSVVFSGKMIKDSHDAVYLQFRKALKTYQMPNSK
ncbi:MAG: MarR family winged helix-turn-helix transcriptional regulator [Clostridia bacterium]